jgi:hypothetical protein
MKKFFKFIDKKILFNILKKLYQIIYINFVKKNYFFLTNNNNYKNTHYFSNLKTIYQYYVKSMDQIKVM